MKRLLTLLCIAFTTGMQAQTFSQDKTYVVNNLVETGDYIQDNGTGIAALGNANDNSYWRLVPTTHTECYYIQNTTTGNYMQSSTSLDQAIRMGSTPVEYYIQLDTSGGSTNGCYGMASTDQSVYDFTTSATMGVNDNKNGYAAGYNAQQGVNRRSFWHITEVHSGGSDDPLRPGLTFQSLDWGARYSNGCAIDTDNDGRQEFIFAGIGTTVTNPGGGETWERQRLTHVARYDGTTWGIVGYQGPSYFDTHIGMNVADRPSLSPCDINLDGIMDIVCFETAGRTYTDEPYLDGISQEGIFLGRGDGTFGKYEPAFIDSRYEPTDFYLRTILSGDVADFNGDGLPDIVGIGYHTNASGDATSYADANVVLLNQGGGVFMVSHYLTDDYTLAYGQNGKTYHFECGQVYAYDFNNDGLPDFLVCANSNDRSALGVEDGSNTHFTEIFLNDPEHPGQFRRQQITHCLPSVSEGGVAIGDVNEDGIPDLFVSGWSGNGRSSYVWNIYLGSIATDGTVSYINAGHSGIPEMRNQNSTNRQFAFIDWDGDGHLDLVDMGWSPTLQTQTCFVCQGAGDGTFAEKWRLPGGSEGSLFFVDWDGDGQNDYVTVAQSDDATSFAAINGLTNVFGVVVNANAAPARPDAPSLHEAQTGNGQVTLAWDDASEAPASTTYEYYVQDENGRLFAGGGSLIGGQSDGQRKVIQPGNAGNARSVTLSLPNGTYTYGIQAVDASYQGSAFATGTFQISDSHLAVADPMTGDDTPEPSCTYQNPVIDIGMPDPTVIRAEDGYFYVYATENPIRNVPIYRSENLVEWDFVGTVFTEQNRPDFVASQTNAPARVWAPDINYIDGKYYLYYSMSRWGSEWECGIGVATADKPEGPYTNHGKMFNSQEIGVQNSIDPFFIEEDGHKYLFWGSFRGIYGVELSADGLSVKAGESPRQIAGTLTEGTYIIKHDGLYYLIGSVGSCCDGENSTYHLVMARSENLFGPYENKVGGKTLDNQFSNLLYRSKDVIGPGHNAEFVQDDSGQWWVLYHGFQATNLDAGRVTFLDRVDWDDEGWPVIQNMKPSLSAACPQFGATAIRRQAAAIGQSFHIASTGKTVKIEQPDGHTFSWQINAIGGQTLRKGQAAGSVIISTAHLAPGMYMVTATAAGQVQTEKVIVRH